jgi:hypothetical protein
VCVRVCACACVRACVCSSTCMHTPTQKINGWGSNSDKQPGMNSERPKKACRESDGVQNAWRATFHSSCKVSAVPLGTFAHKINVHSDTD